MKHSVSVNLCWRSSNSHAAGGSIYTLRQTAARQRWSGGEEEGKPTTWSVVSFGLGELHFFFFHGYDWQSQQRFTRACPCAQSVFIVTERSTQWRAEKEPKRLATHTKEQQRHVSDYWRCYLLLLFTQRGPIIKVCNLARYVRIS